MRKNLQTYRKVNIESGVLSSDPHQLILMMFDGALRAIAEAKGAIERKDLASKSIAITKAINIFSALRESLDKESEPKISENFDNLYTYCITKLIDLSISLKVEGLDEISAFIRPIRDAWSQMPESSKQEGISLIKNKEHSQAQLAAGR
ncbi:flagellar export chaperone FliS [Colwellia sp. M166]|jgi:flagellar protein FliS|uniref:flagellar export chaperone FliS n=1 Tax=Colwellia sp. M166 TaxID=2583805 RepID=UPI00211E74E7|nr:flagellar export chaperone FliS [Colwellia sp. M166]UUO23148.1 flagellar export chaperone FliS [Colwellia sp. M166]|tara:strand:- start:102 stop:548 length:447 start_codon:yes stop_codon:yes gene_type:complete